MSHAFLAPLLVLAAAGAAALPTPAAAAAPVGIAAFGPGAELPGRLVVGDGFWTCGEGRCTGGGETRPVAMQKACQALAREIGAVAAFSVGAAEMTPEALARCNAKAGRAPAALAANN